MKCRIAKEAQLSSAITHYLEKRPLLRFMSLYDDNAISINRRYNVAQ